MHASHHTLSLLTADLDRKLSGATIQNVFSQDRDELLVAFADRPDSLFISCSAQLPLLFLHESFARARRNSVNLLEAANDGRIERVNLHPSDRIVTIALANGHLLEVHLFGPRSNVLLLDRERIVIDAFKRARIVIGNRLELPPVVEIPTITRCVETLRAMQDPIPGHQDSAAASEHPVRAVGQVGSSDITLQAALKSVSSVVPPTVLRELLHRAGLSPDMRLREMTADRWPSLSVAASNVEQEFLTPRFLLVSGPGGLPLRFSTIRLMHALDAAEVEFPDIHMALREFSVRKRSMEAFQEEQHRLRDLLRRRIEKAERTCEAIRTDVGETDRAATYRRYGSLLMAHLATISKGATLWTWTGEGTPCDIPLQPSLTPVQNAQRYFEKAKSAERSRMMTGDRLRVYGAVLSQARSLLSEVESITSRGELRAFMKEKGDALRALGALESEQDQERAPFRIFTVHGGFEVWAGKSSANNDDLTLHHARPEDLWFHARGSSGSHVILKISSAAGEPGKRARQEAAGIAAYYSKMRNAKIVPVAMTRRKYVHKPKGAPPGTVVIAREEVLMATPGLPKEPQHKKERGES